MAGASHDGEQGIVRGNDHQDGGIERSIPIEASDPVLIPYFRRSFSALVMRPAQLNGAAADSWNEFSLSGQISYSVDVRQIAALRRPLGP